MKQQLHQLPDDLDHKLGLPPTFIPEKALKLILLKIILFYLFSIDIASLILLE